MLDPINIQIKERFYDAFDKLYELGYIRTRQSFLDKYGIDRGNFIATRKNNTRRVDSRLLSILVIDYGVSGDWLLSGKGKMFQIK